MPPSVHIIDLSVEKTETWLNQVALEMRVSDRDEAYRVLRAFLHALRDGLTVDGAADLAAQLPTLIRGIFYEGWTPSRVPHRYHTAEEFLDRVAAEALLHGDTEASFAVDAVMRVLRRHVTEDEVDGVLRALPEPMRRLLGAGVG